MHTLAVRKMPELAAHGGQSEGNCGKCGHFGAVFWGSCFRLNNFLGSFVSARFF
jgi:hypothetical protein